MLFVIGALRANVQVTTFTYKKVGDLEIKANVFRTAGGESKRPVLVSIHGGALINGGRDTRYSSWSLPGRFVNSGGIVVSIDHRLAPETKLPAMIEDLKDAYQWIRTEGPVLFGADRGRIAVSGGSAGGYLTLMTGFCVEPRPVVLVSLWGYGDLIGPPWAKEPSSDSPELQKVPSRAEALRQVAGPPVANEGDRKGNGKIFWEYCRLRGLWPNALTGWDPEITPEKFYPFMPLKNVDRRFPPTLLVYGSEDVGMPEQSALMAAEFERHGIAI